MAWLSFGSYRTKRPLAGKRRRLVCRRLCCYHFGHYWWNFFDQHGSGHMALNGFGLANRTALVCQFAIRQIDHDRKCLAVEYWWKAKEKSSILRLWRIWIYSGVVVLSVCAWQVPWSSRYSAHKFNMNWNYKQETGLNRIRFGQWDLQLWSGQHNYVYRPLINLNHWTITKRQI